MIIVEVETPTMVPCVKILCLLEIPGILKTSNI